MAASTAHTPTTLRLTSSGLVLPGERPADVVAFEAEVVDFFVSAAELLGVPKSVAAIYGIVFASPVPLSFAEIEARLDISKGSVSQGLRVLREMGALRAAGPQPGAGSTEPGAGSTEQGARSTEPGARSREQGGRSSELGAGSSAFKAHGSPLDAETPALRGVCYEPDMELRRLVGQFLENRVERQLAAGKTRIDGLEQGTGVYPNGQQKVLRQRVKKLSEWHSKARALLPLAKTFLKLG